MVLLCPVQVFEALYNARVPAAWLKAYPSLKGLGAWTRDLLARIEQLARWAEGTYPRIYWLGGFTYPTGFLTAVLQVGKAAGLRVSLACVPHAYHACAIPKGKSRLPCPQVAALSAVA